VVDQPVDWKHERCVLVAAVTLGLVAVTQNEQLNLTIVFRYRKAPTKVSVISRKIKRTDRVGKQNV
jgi:hypothetical protein